MLIIRIPASVVKNPHRRQYCEIYNGSYDLLGEILPFPDGDGVMTQVEASQQIGNLGWEITKKWEETEYGWEVEIET